MLKKRNKSETDKARSSDQVEGRKVTKMGEAIAPIT
jgi:hypothetical protein